MIAWKSRPRTRSVLDLPEVHVDRAVRTVGGDVRGLSLHAHARGDLAYVKLDLMQVHAFLRADRDPFLVPSLEAGQRHLHAVRSRHQVRKYERPAGIRRKHSDLLRNVADQLHRGAGYRASGAVRDCSHKLSGYALSKGGRRHRQYEQEKHGEDSIHREPPFDREDGERDLDADARTTAALSVGDAQVGSNP